MVQGIFYVRHEDITTLSPDNIKCPALYYIYIIYIITSIITILSLFYLM